MSYRPRRSPQLVAHKGGVTSDPENSLAAFASAASIAVDMIEMDVCSSADGHPMIVHGPRLEDTTNGRGRVNAHPRDALKALRLHHDDVDHAIPELAEVLDAIGADVAINCDVKHPKVLAATIAELRARDRLDNSVITGLAGGLVRRARRIDADVSILWNLTYLDKLIARAPRIRTRWLAARLRRVRSQRIIGLNINHIWVDAKLVEAVHGLGLDIWVFTTDDQGRVDELVALGVDSITTNRPDLVHLPG